VSAPPGRNVLYAAVFAGCAAASLGLAARPARAGGLTGALAADKSRVAEGGIVRLVLTVSGPASSPAIRLLQPLFPPTERFELLSTGQRNEISIGKDGETFSAAFLYTLRAREAGEERIPAFEVREKVGDGEQGEKGGEERDTLLLTVEGITLVVEPPGRGVYRAGIVVAAVAGLSAAALAASCLARRRRPLSAAPPPPRGGCALAALAAMEDARPLLGAGDRGAYAGAIHPALAECAAREGDEELAALAGSLAALRERVRYAKDEEAEREIRDGVRRAEQILKRKLRDA